MRLLYALAIILIVIMQILFIMFVNFEHKVMSEKQKVIHFDKIEKRGFWVGKEHKRPWIIVRDTRGKLELHTEKGWISL